MMEQRQIDFAWTLVDWRTFDPGMSTRMFVMVYVYLM